MATQIKVFTSNSMRTVLTECIPEFERESGYAVSVSFDPAQVTLKRIEAGETADLAILGAAAIDQLAEQGKIIGATRCPLVRSDAAIGARAGAVKPDVSTAEAFKRTLINARSIAYASEGASGIHFVCVIEQLGIADQIKAKTITRPGGLLAELLVSGEAELAIQHVPELMAVKGIEVAGTFPPGLEFFNVLAAGLFADAREPTAAAVLLDYLKTPAMAKRYVAVGLRPVFS